MATFFIFSRFGWRRQYNHSVDRLIPYRIKFKHGFQKKKRIKNNPRTWLVLPAYRLLQGAHQSNVLQNVAGSMWSECRRHFYLRSVYISIINRQKQKQRQYYINSCNCFPKKRNTKDALYLCYVPVTLGILGVGLSSGSLANKTPPSFLESSAIHIHARQGSFFGNSGI